MRVAICDDDKSDILTIKNYINRYDSSIEYDIYYSAEELLKGMGNENFDLVFLDIRMKTLNGFEAAKFIMERFEENSPLIVFITRSSKYTILGYEVAFRYLMKPIEYEEFSGVLSAAIKKIAPKTISLSYYGKSIFISVNDICYCEVFGHNTVIHAEDNSYEFRYSLKKIEEMLQGCGFARPHSSYLINLDYIESVSGNEILLKNGLSIKIGRHKKANFMRALHQHLRR